MHVFITSPNWHLAQALYDALRAVPHDGARLACFDWGCEPAHSKEDRFIIVADKEDENAWKPKSCANLPAKPSRNQFVFACGFALGSTYSASDAWVHWLEELATCRA